MRAPSVRSMPAKGEITPLGRDRFCVFPRLREGLPLARPPQFVLTQSGLRSGEGRRTGSSRRALRPPRSRVCSHLAFGRVLPFGLLARKMSSRNVRSVHPATLPLPREAALCFIQNHQSEVEGWGGGVSRYFVACEKMGLPPTVVSEESATLKVTFYRLRRALADERVGAKGKEKSKEKGKEKGKEKSKEKILSVLASHPAWTTADLVRETGLSRSGIERNLRLLKATGRLRRDGADKGGIWQVLEA